MKIPQPYCYRRNAQGVVVCRRITHANLWPTKPVTTLPMTREEQLFEAMEGRR